jgi:hypothetical protein
MFFGMCFFITPIAMGSFQTLLVGVLIYLMSKFSRRLHHRQLDVSHEVVFFLYSFMLAPFLLSLAGIIIPSLPVLYRYADLNRLEIGIAFYIFLFLTSIRLFEYIYASKKLSPKLRDNLIMFGFIAVVSSHSFLHNLMTSSPLLITLFASSPVWYAFTQAFGFSSSTVLDNILKE